MLKHLDAGCVVKTALGRDDIDKQTWQKIDEEVSRQGFQRLPKDLRDEIDLWVLDNIDDYTKSSNLESRKWELRKWNMTWKILFPRDHVPPNPCINPRFKISPLNLTDT